MHSLILKTTRSFGFVVSCNLLHHDPVILNSFTGSDFSILPISMQHMQHIRVLNLNPKPRHRSISTCTSVQLPSGWCTAKPWLAVEHEHDALNMQLLCNLTSSVFVARIHGAICSAGCGDGGAIRRKLPASRKRSQHLWISCFGVP